MNWTDDDEATLAILLRRKERANEERRGRLEEIAEAMVSSYGYPADGDAEAGITRKWIAHAITACADDICAVFVPTKPHAAPIRHHVRRNAAPRDLPTCVYQTSAR